MAIQQKLHTKLVQKLILTPSLQQAIKLLPMSTLELADLLNQEMVENPMLEEVPTEELQPAEQHAAARSPSRNRPRPKRPTPGTTPTTSTSSATTSTTATGPAPPPRSRNCQHVDRLTLLGKSKTLVHSEPMLLVDHGEREVPKFDLLLEQRMGADEHMGVAEDELFQDILAFASALASGQDSDIDPGRRRQRRYGVEMLPRQEFGRCHQRGLAAAFDHGRGGKQGHHGLA